MQQENQSMLGINIPKIMLAKYVLLLSNFVPLGLLMFNTNLQAHTSLY
jgi:hypothetical protein